MTIAVRSGSLRHRVTIRQYNRVADAIGGFARTPVDICSLWGRIIPLSGDEPFISDKLRTRLTHRILLRTIPTDLAPGGWFSGRWMPERFFSPGWWGNDLTDDYAITKLFVEYRDRIFRIHSALRPEEQDGVWTLLCEEMPQ